MGLRENYLTLISTPFVNYFTTDKHTPADRTTFYIKMAYAYMAIIRARSISVKDMENYIDIILSQISNVYMTNQETDRLGYFNKTTEGLIEGNAKEQKQVSKIGLAFVINAILCTEHQTDQSGYIDISEKDEGAKEDDLELIEEKPL